MPTQDHTTKQCTRCHETKIIQEFHRMAKSPDGYRTICKKCRAIAEGKVYIPYEPPGFKYCRHCERMLPRTTEYFQTSKTSRYGLESRCRECKNAEWVERYHADEEAAREYARARYAANPEQHRERSKRRSLEHPEYAIEWYQENKERLKPIRQLYYANNRDYLLAINADWTKNNPDRISIIQARYRHQHPEYVRLRNKQSKAKRRALILNAPGTHTAADIALQVAAQTDKYGKLHCWWCGSVITGTYHLDHKDPLSRGGSNGATNIVVTCPKCNLSKNNKTPAEWAGRLL